MRNIGHVYPKRIRHAYINKFIIIYSSLALGLLMFVSINLFLSKKDTIVFRLNQALKTDKLNIVYQPIYPSKIIN
jgi:sensor c-di-GMP phosphodiesterase-like protein